LRRHLDLTAAFLGGDPAAGHGAVLVDELRHAAAKSDIEPRAPGMALNRAPHGIDHGLAATPGQVKARDRVAIPVNAALCPIDNGEEAHPVGFQPTADLLSRARDVLL